MTIHWAGGATSRHEVIRPVARYEQLRDYGRLVARVAALVNSRSQDIGARRLHTILERLLDPVSFEASDAGRSRDEVIDAGVVRTRLKEVVEDEDLSRYIL